MPSSPADPSSAYLPSSVSASPNRPLSSASEHREERGYNTPRDHAGEVEIEMGTHESGVRIQPSSSTSPSPSMRQTSAWISKVNPAAAAAASDSDGAARSSRPPDEQRNEQETSKEDNENSDEATGLMRDYMDYQLCATTHGKSEESASATAATGSGSGTAPQSYHYHCRPFTMARLWWMKHNKANIVQYRRDKTFNHKLNEYLRENRNDWMPPTSEWLRKQGSLAYLWAWEQYFFNAVLLPIGVLWLGKKDSDFGRMCRNLYQTWAFTLFHVPIPDSVMIEFPWKRKVFMCACLTLAYLSLVVPIPLRYWKVYEPIGGDLTSRVDCWFPPALAALMNVCVAGIAVVSHDFAATESKYQVFPDDSQQSQRKAAFEEATEAQLERDDQARLRRNLTKHDSGESTSNTASPHSAELHLSASPSEFLVALCEGMKQNDFRMLAPSSGVFAFIAIIVSIMPNLVSVFWGGEFLGDCNAHTDSDLECPFPAGVMRFAVLIRITMMAITTYFFSFILHQTAVYFKNKTLVRSRLLTLLNRLLGTHDITELIKTQTHQIEQETKVIIDNHPSSSESSTSPRSPPGPRPLSSDLSNLPHDLRVWFDMYRFMDQFDQREGWQVQSTLAWYAAFVVFCCVNVLVAAIQAWTGVDQQVIFFTCALVASLIGVYVFIILWKGIQINQLPADMHESIKRAEMRSGQALAIVQRIVKKRALTLEDEKNARKVTAALLACSLEVSNSLLQRFAASFDFLILSSPFTVLMVPLTKTLISTGVVAGVTTLASVIAATISGALRGT